MNNIFSGYSGHNDGSVPEPITSIPNETEIRFKTMLYEKIRKVNELNLERNPFDKINSFFFKFDNNFFLVRWSKSKWGEPALIYEI